MNIFLLFIGLIALFLILVCLIPGMNGNKQGQEASGQPENDNASLFTDPEWNSGDEYVNTMYTYIAGINFRIKKQLEFGFIGYTEPEPANPHDKNAVKICMNTGHQLGYVPKKELREYHRDSEGRQCPCIGYVYKGDNGMVYSNVLIIFSHDEKMVTLNIAKYARWLVDKRGLKFLPMGLDFNDAKPKTKAEALRLLNKAIEELRQS